jgi:cyclopropane fatty-acyl-phospholipid synthase-like methyltransferase
MRIKELGENRMEENYYKTIDSVEEYIRLAKDVNGSDLIEKFKRFLPSNAIILEIGTGSGTDWNILNQDYTVIGSDNSQDFLSHLVSSNPSGRFVELNAITLNIDENFDGLYSNKVMHHLKDNELINSIKRQHEILNPDGIICHSFWKGTGSEIFKGLFVNYHLEKVLREYFEKYFEILVLESYAEFEEADSLLLIGQKKNDTSTI